ncbi:MAG: agmatine deiminase family protein [Fidelibacterota bacterium]
MTYRMIIPRLILLVLAFTAAGPAQKTSHPPIMPRQVWTGADGEAREELPIGFTAREWENRAAIRDNGRSTDPPPFPIRNIPEFERMQGVLIRYPLGIPVDLVRQFAEDVTVYCLVAAAQQSSAVAAFQSAGVNPDQVEFITGNTDSYWTRDYGPWWVVDGNGDISVVDFTYNRPRPNDNLAPWKVADYLSAPYFASDIIHTGGNYMTDGFGISASSDLVYVENPTLAADQILTVMNQYYGIQTYHVLDDPNNTYIDHIDCWGKYLAPDKVLIRSVPESHSQYAEIEAVADYFATQNGPYGRPYTVVRVFTPNDEPYTNSLILNNKIYVPMVPWGGDNNQAAIETYQAACPGYTIVPVDPPAGNEWLSTDALHCRAKGIPDQGLLEILHIPPADPETPDTVILKARIVPHSGAGLLSDSLGIKWYSAVHPSAMEIPAAQHGVTDSFQVRFPPPPATTTIYYHWVAADSSGRRETSPLAGDFSIRIPGILAPGDVSMDRELSISDLIRIMDAVNTGEVLEGYEALLADYDGNGAVNLLDGILLLNQIMNE